MGPDLRFYTVQDVDGAWRWELRHYFSQRPIARSATDFSTAHAADEAVRLLQHDLGISLPSAANEVAPPSSQLCSEENR